MPASGMLKYRYIGGFYGSLHAKLPELHYVFDSIFHYIFYCHHPSLRSTQTSTILSPLSTLYAYIRSPSSSLSMATTGVREEPFPAPSRHAKGEVHGIPTEVSCTNFADKILVTVSQDGRLAQWVSQNQVPQEVILWQSKKRHVLTPHR